MALDKGRIVVDDQLRTTNPHVYVVGDVAGGYQFTHVAEHHAGIVLRQAIFKLWWAKPSRVDSVVHVHRSGARARRAVRNGSEAAATSRTRSTASRSRKSTARAPKAKREGFAKIVTDPKGKLLGAAIVGPHAGELIAEYGLALTKGMKAKRHVGVDPHVPDAGVDQPPRRRPAA